MSSNNSKIFLYFSITFIFVCVGALSIFSYFFSKNNGGIGLEGIISFGGGNDSFFYWSEISSYFENSLYVPTETSIYVPLMADLVKTVGVLDPLVVKTINFFIYMGATFLIVKEMDLIFPVKSNRYRYMVIGITLFAIYPSLLMNITSGIYRDIWILFFMLMVTICFLQFLSQKTKISVIKLVLSIILLTMFRPYAGLWAILSIVITEIFFHINKRNRKVIVIAILLFLFTWYTFFRNISLPIVNMSLSEVFEYRGDSRNIMKGGSDFYAPLNQSNFLFFIKNYLYGFLSNFAGPLVWQWKSFTTSVTGILEGIPILLMIIAVICKRESLKDEDLVLLIFLISWIALISLSNNNLGTAARLRMYSIIQLIIITVKINLERKHGGSNEYSISKK